MSSLQGQEMVTLQVTRSFDAPAELLFDAWFDPSGVCGWLFATPGGVMKRVEIDARVGGRFRIDEQRGDRLAEHFGEYLEIDRPRRLVFTFSAVHGHQPSIVTVEIAPEGGGCRLTLTHEMEARWADYTDRTHQGWTTILEGLSGEVAKGRELTLTRLLDAPRALVYRMWSDPEHMNRWYHPKDFTVPEATMDFRPGGVWSAHIRSPKGTDYRMKGVYREIVPEERIVFTHTWLASCDEDGAGHETVITLTFEDHGAGTKLTFHQAVFRTVESRNSHSEGWNEVLDNLAQYLAELDSAGD